MRKQTTINRQNLRDTLNDVGAIETLVQEMFGIDPSFSIKIDCPARAHAHPGGGHNCCQWTSDTSTLYCHACNTQFDVFALAAISLGETDVVGLSGARFAEAEKYLIKRFAPNFSAMITSEPSQIYINRCRLYDQLYQIFRKDLFEEKGKAVYEYLVKKRKYDKDVIYKTEFIRFPVIERIHNWIKSNSSKTEDEILESIKNLGLRYSTFNASCLAAPFRDIDGNIIGFIERDISGEEKEKYNTHFHVKHPKNNLFNAHLHRKSKRVIIVEGYLDAAYWSYADSGLQFVAIGAARMTAPQAEQLTRMSCDEVILCGDQDDTGTKATLENAKLIHQYAPNKKILVLSKGAMGDLKDPDEFIVDRGIPAFKDILDKSTVDSWEYLYDAYTNPVDNDELLNLINVCGDSIIKSKMIKRVSKVIGLPASDIKNAAKHHDKQKKEKARNRRSVHMQFDVPTFWEVSAKETKNGVELSVDYKIENILECLSLNGFRLLEYPEDKHNDPTIVYLKDNIVTKTTTPRILSALRNTIDAYYENVKKIYEEDSDVDSGETIMDVILEHEAVREQYFDKYRLFSDLKLYWNLPFIHMKSFVKDTPTKSYLFYKDIAVEITKDSVKTIKYSDIDGYVHSDQIINRDYNPNRIKSDYELFVERSTETDGSPNEARNRSVRSAIGYLMHSYNTSEKVIVLCDEIIGDTLSEANGRSGKSLTLRGVSEMKNVVDIDGRQFNPSDQFGLSRVNSDSQVVIFNDVAQKFPFDAVFNAATDGLEINKKFRVPFRLSGPSRPKLAITTNYALRGSGSSYSARQYIVELSSHYNAEHTPIDEFGRRFFDDWDNDCPQWGGFDRFMIECLQSYLKNGLTKQVMLTHETKRVIVQVSEPVFKFLSPEYLASIVDSCQEGELGIQLSTMFYEFVEETNCRHITRNMFYSRFKTLASYYNLETTSIDRRQTIDGGKRRKRLTYYGLKLKEDTDKKILEALEELKNTPVTHDRYPI